MTPIPLMAAPVLEQALRGWSQILSVEKAAMCKTTSQCCMHQQAKCTGPHQADSCSMELQKADRQVVVWQTCTHWR